MRAQITRLINEYDNRSGPLDEIEASILHSRLSSWWNDFNIVNNEIEPLVTDEDVENGFQPTCEYQDRIVTYFTRLQRQMTVTCRPMNAASAGKGRRRRSSGQGRSSRNSSL
ncbi:hypothetical protein MRX96_032622 [Rhipicephalus microplus]